MKKKTNNKSGFTLGEVLTVMAIVGIVSVLALTHLSSGIIRLRKKSLKNLPPSILKQPIPEQKFFAED